MRLMMILSFILILNVTTFGQNLDLKKGVIVLSCTEHFYGSEKGYSVETPHHLEEKKQEQDSLTITIDPVAKTVKIMDHTLNKMLFDFKYMSHAQASNQNDLGQAYTETMFLVRNKEVLMLTHDNKKRVLNLIKNNNELLIFKNLTPLNQ